MVFKNEDHQNQLTTFAGLDVDWYGVDLKGNIGYFTSAGHAPIPMQVSSIEADLAKVHEFFLRMSPSYSTNIEIAPSFKLQEVPASMRDLHVRYQKSILEMGQRGLFCFDADPSGKPTYVRLLKPGRAMNLEELPDFPRAALGQIALDCDFSQTESLS